MVTQTPIDIEGSQVPVLPCGPSDEQTERVQLRESGVSQRDYVARVMELNTILDRAQLENFTITNENRPLTDVAHEVLVKAGWISKLTAAKRLSTNCC